MSNASVHAVMKEKFSVTASQTKSEKRKILLNASSLLVNARAKIVLQNTSKKQTSDNNTDEFN